MAFWMGKAMGSMFGLMTGGPFGMMFGAFFGHLFDTGMERWLQSQAMLLGQFSRTDVQRLFFSSLYRAMGRVAKSDGRVNEQEIAAASFVMDKMLLKGKQRQQAVDYFNEGKNSSLDIQDDLRSLGSVLNPAMTRMFMEVLVTIAYSDGRLTDEEERCIQDICRQLGAPESLLEEIERKIQDAMRHARGEDSEAETIQKAYATLGVDEQISDRELKQEYRRLMSHHHPDKLSAQGLPDEMVQLAKEKTQEIQTAYSLIKKYRTQ